MVRNTKRIEAFTQAARAFPDKPGGGRYRFPGAAFSTLVREALILGELQTGTIASVFGVSNETVESWSGDERHTSSPLHKPVVRYLLDQVLKRNTP